jgi:hypothetical protein
VAIKEELQKRIERKVEEIREMEIRLREAQSYLTALQDMSKLLPRDQNATQDPSQVLRPGSAVARAREAIKRAGKPLHITEILNAIGSEADKKNRISLGGSLSGYSRRGEIFTRPAPNTFGLLEFQNATVRAEAEPPVGFGVVGVVGEEALEADLESVEEGISAEDIPF